MNLNNALYIRIKVVPGASRDAISGILGDRLKVKTSAPPEDGKANKAICKLLAKSLGIKPAQVNVHRGHTNPEKTIRIDEYAIDTISASLGIENADLKKIAFDKE